MYSTHTLTLDGDTLQVNYAKAHSQGDGRGYVKIGTADYYNGKDSFDVSGTPAEIEHLAGLLVDAARQLREQTLSHYDAVRAEAEAWAKDKAQGYTDDALRDGAA